MLGITDDHVAAIGSDGYMDSPLLTPREKATVLWAEHVTRNTAKVRDDVAEEVQRHFTDAEFVELTFVISYFNMRNRYHDSLKLPNDEAEIVEDVGRLRPDPAKLKAFLQEVLDNWPDAFPEPNE
ncbi:MAG: carboxymuconolactone decarboxylase family protein [Nitrospinae bacterium]|nr:carboxymuconolactone decarboxylase family protein [Nitrospinota bacterium]